MKRKNASLLGNVLMGLGRGVFNPQPVTTV